MRTNRWVRTLGLVLLSAVVLAACGGAGAGDNGGSAPDFSNIDLVSVTGAGAGVLVEDEGQAAPYLGVANTVSGFIALFGVFEDWSPDMSSSYDYGGIDVTWSQTDDSWCWSLYGEEGEIDFEFCVTDTGSDYLLTVRGYGDLLLQGNLAYDGTTGDFTLYGEGPTAIYTYAWQPATVNPYDWQITAESLVASETSITILTTDSGDEGQYSGLQNGDPFDEVWPG